MEKLHLPSITKKIVNQHNFKFSKSLGQNFLIDENIINNIVSHSNIEEDDIVLEIGPGIGTLTQALAQKASKVIAVEIDKKLIPILKESLGDFDNITLVNEDILKLDIKTLLEKEAPDKKVKVIANLPYYITTPIIMRFLEEHLPIKSLTIMVQKEVAERIQSPPSNKSYGSLSVAVQYYCNAKIVMTVPKTVFIPQPKIDSAVIRLDILDEPKVSLIDEALFFKVVKGSFSQRRKTLLNTLSSSMGLSKDFVKSVLEPIDIDPIRRGETLSIDEFAKLSNAFFEKLEQQRVDG